MELTPHISILLLTLLQFSKTVTTLEYIFPQNVPSTHQDVRIHSYTQNPKIQQYPLTYHNYNTQWHQPIHQQGQGSVQQRQEMVEHGGGGEGMTQQHTEQATEQGHDEPENESGNQLHSFAVGAGKTLSFVAALKIVLAIFPFVICLVFVPLLVITIGVLIIPIVRLKSYAEAEGEPLARAFGRGTSIGSKEEISRHVISSIEKHLEYK